NLQYKHITCNICSERCARKRQEANPKKKTKITTDLEVVVPTISSSIFRTINFFQIDNILKDYNNLKPVLETSIFDDRSANMIEVYDNSDEYNDNKNILLYCIDKIKIIVTTQFQKY
ncbi:30283_t:CDS:1, partial [Racocetra persica]